MTNHKAETRRCALPGCEELIELTADKAARRFCCAAHRAVSRQRRREADEQAALQSMLLVEIPEPAREPEPEPSIWMRQPQESPRPASSGPGLSTGYTPLDLTPVGAARTEWAASRAGLLSTSGRGRGGTKKKLTPAQLRARSSKRRAQTVAAISAMAVLVGGGNLVINQNTEPADGTGPKSPVALGPAPTDLAGWASQAEVSLASVSRQLDVIAQVEEAWNRSPVAQRLASPPAAVQMLLNRKAELEQAKVMMQSQLAAYRSWHDASAQMAAAQAELAAVERALEDVPAAAPDAARVAQIEQQRDMWLRRRDTKAAEVADLSKTVQAAITGGLPDPASEQVTQEVGESVLAMASNPELPQQPDGPDAVVPPVQALVPREEVGRDRQPVETGAPPRGDQPTLDLSVLEPAAGDPVEADSGLLGGGGVDSAAPAAGETGMPATLNGGGPAVLDSPAPVSSESVEPASFASPLPTDVAVPQAGADADGGSVPAGAAQAPAFTGPVAPSAPAAAAPFKPSPTPRPAPAAAAPAAQAAPAAAPAPAAPADRATAPGGQGRGRGAAAGGEGRRAAAVGADGRGPAGEGRAARDDAQGDRRPGRPRGAPRGQGRGRGAAAGGEGRRAAAVGADGRGPAGEGRATGQDASGH